MKKIDAADFDKLCKLAHIQLSSEKSEELMQDCNQLLEHIEKLNSVNTDTISADFQLPDHGPLPLNEDIAETCFTIEEALSNAPAKQDQYFWVPDVIDSKKQKEPS